MEIYDIVIKLVGKVNPIGESTEDEQRFRNLIQLTELINALLTDVIKVSIMEDKQEYSMKKAGQFADNFLIHIGIK